MTDRDRVAGSDRLAALLRFSIERPRTTLGVWLLIAAVAIAGVSQLRFDTTTASVLDRSDSRWSFYERSMGLFGGDEVLVVALEADDPFDPSAIAEVSRLTAVLEGIAGVRRVDSIATVPVVRVDSEGVLRLDPAVPEQSSISQDDARAIERILLNDRIAPRSLVSADGRVFGLNILIESNADDLEFDVVQQAARAVAGKRAWLSGVPVFRTGVNSRTRAQLLMFVPAVLGLVGVLIRVTLGSSRAVVAAFLASGLGNCVTFGVMGVMGKALSISTIILPSILFALGSAYVMHLLSEARGVAKADALSSLVLKYARPIALSGLTEVLGFLSLTATRIEVIRDLGTFGAIGVLAILAATLTAVPAFLRLAPLPQGDSRIDLWLTTRGPKLLVALVAARQGRILVLWLTCFAVLGAGILRLEIETDATRWFPHGSPIRDAYDSIRLRLSGISPMNIVVTSDDGGSVVTPEVIRAVDALSTHLQGLPHVGKVLSVADPLRQLHGAFSGSGTQPLPNNRATIEQYLLLLDSVEYLSDVITRDRTAGNILLRVNNNGSRELLSIAEEASRWWRNSGPVGFSATPTGIMYEFARAQEEITWGQLRGFGIALVPIALALLLVFRKPAVLIVALVPNVAPLVMMYGLMGIAGVPLDAVAVGLGSAALGIAVDDTVHLIYRFREAREAGLGAEQALERSLSSVVAAVVYTSIATGIGFSVLLLSSFAVTQTVGAVMSGIVGVCLLADLTLLPPLLLTLARRGRL